MPQLTPTERRVRGVCCDAVGLVANYTPPAPPLGPQVTTTHAYDTSPRRAPATPALQAPGPDELGRKYSES